MRPLSIGPSSGILMWLAESYVVSKGLMLIGWITLCAGWLIVALAHSIAIGGSQGCIGLWPDFACLLIPFLFECEFDINV